MPYYRQSILHDAGEIPMRYGEAQIAEAKLEAVPNPYPDRDYRIDITCPEFTCLCPRSGFPDFATIRITYVPDERIVELKALKLYLNRYRNEYLFHEAAVNRILDDLVAVCAPRWIRIVGDFNVRGNLKTVITATWAKAGYEPRANPSLCLLSTSDVG
jgi:7-cyano-7-deazaguanine reductase